MHIEEMIELALDVWFRENLASGIVSSITLALDAAAASGQVNADFLRGVLAMAKAQALQYGIAWPALVAEVQAAIGDDHVLLLELAMTERPQVGP